MALRLPKLTEDWKQAYRWYSVHWYLVIGGTEAAWAKYGDHVARYIPAPYLHGALAFAAILGIASRVLAQTGLFAKEQKV